MKLMEMPHSEDREKYAERQALFIETCAKIRTAWSAMGYSGDPIENLVASVFGMSVYGHILSEDT